MNILVVDHSKVFRALWHRLVLQAGHEPIMVATSEEGLEVLAKRRVDLVCVSMTLAEGDGIEFCRQARMTRRGRHVPLIVLSSTEDKEARLRAFEAGATDIHPKTDIEELFNQASRFVEGDEQRISGRVLYVEDSSVVTHVMLSILERLGLEVDHFTSAEEALKVFDPSLHDLVVSDILVEGEMSGMGLISRLRERYPEKIQVPILAVSGMDDATRRIELFRLGVNDFISKPVVEEEVIARASNLITNKQLFDQVQSQRHHLYDLAMIDQLTGLYSRNSLSEFAIKAFSQANRHDLPLSVILLDLDRFQQVNDSHGHHAADEILSSIGELLKRRYRREDFAIRFGGEAFMIIMLHCGLEDAGKRAEQLRHELENLRPSGVSITASLGVTARPAGLKVDMDSLFRVAEKAVSQAKEAGRNRVVTLSVGEDAHQAVHG